MSPAMAAAAVTGNYRCAGDDVMDKFEKLSGIAAPMPLINIDTDMIIPKVFLKTIKRSALASICLMKCAMTGKARKSRFRAEQTAIP